jgi:hypothetical protein
MGFFKKIALGALGVKTYQNVYNRPVVTPPSGFLVKGMKQKGLGSTWLIQYSKVDQQNLTQSFKVTRSTSAVNIGGHIFNINWP